MKTKLFLSLALCALLWACKKGNSNDPVQKKEQEVPSFKPGNGFAYLASYAVGNGGGISFMKSLDISVTDDGKLHWLFSRGNPYGNNLFLYNKVLDANTGDTLGTGSDLKKVGGSIQLNPYDAAYTDQFGFVPYTNKIYRSYRSGNAKYKVEGDVGTFEYGGYDGTAIQATYYANGLPTLHFASNIKPNLQDIVTQVGAFEARDNKLVALAKIYKTYWSYGQAHNFDKIYHGGISFPNGYDGGSSLVTFTASKAYLFKQIGTTIVAVDSIPYQGVPFYTGSVVPQVPFKVKTSKDMKKAAILCYEPDSYTAFSGKYKYTTFLVDHTTNQITIAINQFAMKKVDLDFDLQGNIYYAVQPEGSETAKVMKVSSQGETIFAKNFFDSYLQIYNLQVVNDKVYIASNTSTDRLFSRISLFVAR